MNGADVLLAGEPAAFDSAPSYTVMSDSLRQLAGVELVSTRSRLMYAWSLQNFRLLFGDLPPNQPVIVQRRAIRERLHALTPFFEQGSEIVPVVTGDTLYWAVELYSTSASYPLSQRFTVLGEERSYMQHAVTALVHAGSGRVLFIVTTSPDPVTLSWMARFPGLLKAASSLSPALRAQLPPVTDGARTQALAFAAAGFRGDTNRPMRCCPISEAWRRCGRCSTPPSACVGRWPRLADPRVSRPGCLSRATAGAGAP